MNDLIIKISWFNHLSFFTIKMNQIRDFSCRYNYSRSWQSGTDLCKAQCGYCHTIFFSILFFFMLYLIVDILEFTNFWRVTLQKSKQEGKEDQCCCWFCANILIQQLSINFLVVAGVWTPDLAYFMRCPNQLS